MTFGTLKYPLPESGAFASAIVRSKRRPFAILAQGRRFPGFVQNLRHRLDSDGIQLVQFVDVGQDAVQIPSHARDLVIAQRQVRQFGNVPHFLFSKLHAFFFDCR